MTGRAGIERAVVAEKYAQFVVYGVPQPQGSTRAFQHRHTGRIVTTSDNKRLKPWRQEIIGVIQSERPVTFTRYEPVRVTCDFWFSRPPSVKRVSHVVKPDLDKLIRAIFDALTLSGVIHDDAQITTLHTKKHYCVLNPRVVIQVEEGI